MSLFVSLCSRSGAVAESLRQLSHVRSAGKADPEAVSAALRAILRTRRDG